MDTVQMFEELDLSSESNAFLQIQESMDLLNHKVAALSMEGRISRGEVLQLISQHAVEIDPRYPIQSFTQIATPTNLSIAQEGIFSTLGRKFVDMLKWAAALMVKIFRWIIDFITFRRLREKKVVTVAANIKTVQRATADLRGNGHRAVEEEIIAKADAQYHASYNYLVDDMIHAGQYLVLVRDIQVQVMELETTVSARLKTINHLLKQLPQNQNDDLAFEANAKALMTSAPGLKLKEKLNRAGVAVPVNMVSPKEIMQVLLQELTKLSLGKDLDSPEVSVAMGLIDQNRNGVLAPILLVPETTARNLNDMMRELKLLQSRTRLDTTETGMRVMERLIQVALDEAHAVQAFFSVINLYSNARDRFFEAVWNVTSSVYQSTYNQAMKGTPAEQRAAAAVTSRMKSQLKK